MAVQVPSLSASGWVGNISEKCDKLIGYFFVSDFSQSHLYAGNIASLPYIIKASAENRSLLRSETSKQLTNLLRPYFDSVQVDVQVLDGDPTDPGKVNLRVDATVTQDGTIYSVGKEIQTINSKVVAIFNANNGN
ncbi:hypothetical protein D3C80_1021950 [compost metagenome]|jgi:hypothetical protein